MNQQERCTKWVKRRETKLKSNAVGRMIYYLKVMNTITLLQATHPEEQHMVSHRKRL